jgi:energy-coupling factor transporter transmembrane protein EcfT
MQARGYKGRFPVPCDLRIQWRDMLQAGIWVAAGIALVLFDFVKG